MVATAAEAALVVVATRRQRRATRATRGPALEARVVRLELGALEIARGSDGFLRGAPEPVLVAGLFVERDGIVELLARNVVRFARPSKIPATVRAEGTQDVRAERRVSTGERFFGLVCAIEEDVGSGVRRAFEMLEEPASLLCFRTDTREPEPIALAAALDGAWSGSEKTGVGPYAIELLANGRPFAAEVAGDDFLGATLVGLERAWTSSRLRFASANNDWTALARARW